MKTLSITALILTLSASPAGAAMVTIQYGDSATQCGLIAARLISDSWESPIVFPDESLVCGEIADETVVEAETEVIHNVPVTAPALKDPSLEIAALLRSTNDKD
jgi:hypothetical protein